MLINPRTWAEDECGGESSPDKCVDRAVVSAASHPVGRGVQRAIRSSQPRMSRDKGRQNVIWAATRHTGKHDIKGLSSGLAGDGEGGGSGLRGDLGPALASGC